MSQISRRNFMKCAGAAALAIAASGILTGCDNTLDVEVTFVYNGQTLPLRGTGKVVTGEQYMDTATIVLPAEYQEQYKVRAEKVKVIRENGTRKAVVELVVKTAVWTVSYRLGEKEVLSGSVEAAAGDPPPTGKNPNGGDPHRHGKKPNENELKALDKMFYKLPEDAKVTIGNGVVIVPVEKIMGQVKVDYYYKITETVERCLGYPEVVDVWKGTNIIKKSQLTRLEKACADMSYDASSVAQEILFDWADNVVKIYVKSY